jgi:glycerate 2-kinase
MSSRPDHVGRASLTTEQALSAGQAMSAGQAKQARRVLACPDKFRGTATGLQAATAIARAVVASGCSATVLPLADGGEGTLDALAAAGGRFRTTTVTGPLGTPIEAQWLLWGRKAYIEMARASGLLLAGGREGNRPLDATTFGTGELIAAAVAEGATTITVTLGGSATTDGGLGALDALARLSRMGGVKLVVACDVDTPFEDAARIFGPQKGASSAEVELLTRRLALLADRYLHDHGVDVRGVRGTGAAGGLAGALVAIGAELVSGFTCVAEAIGFPEALETTDLVVTGEGYLDTESFNGKVVGGVCERAIEKEVPVLIVAGNVEIGLEDRWPIGRRDLVTVVSLVGQFGLDRAMADTQTCIESVVLEHLGSLS